MQKPKYGYTIEQKPTGAAPVEAVTIVPTTISLVQGATSTDSVSASAALGDPTSPWYAKVEGKYYRIYIPEGKKQIKIERTDTDVSGTATPPTITYSVAPENSGVSIVEQEGQKRIKVENTATAGEYTITATAEGTDKFATCTVTVIQKISSIALASGTKTIETGNTISIQEGETITLGTDILATVTPATNVEPVTYSYSSYDETKVTATNGVITGVAQTGETPVEVTITATGSLSGTQKSVKLYVTVTEAPPAPALSYVTWTLSGGTYQPSLSATAPSASNLETDYAAGHWWNMKTTTNGIECYWVWIPRFAYIVSDVQNSSAKQIDVQLVGTNLTGTPTIDNKQYLVHPAFTFGTGANKQELAGFWVAKFEASAYNLPNNVGYGGGDTTSYKVQVLPGVQSWRNIATTNIFTVCRNMTASGGALEGVASDSHMMKNSEWGAVAILSQSKYGIYNTNSLTRATANGGDGTLRVWTNPNGYGSGATIMTGYVGESEDAKTEYNAGSAVTSYLWNDITHDGPKASTTGTIYGVYDMAGGSWEYVAGLYSTNNTGLLGSNIDTKYYDVNADASSDPNKTLAITNNWNTDYSNFAGSNSPVFVRGGGYNSGGNAGVFASDSDSGSAGNNYSFRPVWVAP